MSELTHLADAGRVYMVNMTDNPEMHCSAIISGIF